MRIRRILVLSSMLLPAISTCSSRSIRMQRGDVPRDVTQVPSETIPDPQIENVIPGSYYVSRDPQNPSRYYYNKVDLNSDGKPEVLVQLRGDLVCGSGGCDTFILQQSNSGYRIISDIALTRAPVIVSQSKTNGWNDLVVYVAGGGIMQGYYVSLQFNGRTYPGNPTSISRLNGKIVGTAYLANADISPGIVLRR